MVAGFTAVARSDKSLRRVGIAPLPPDHDVRSCRAARVQRPRRLRPLDFDAWAKSPLFRVSITGALGDFAHATRVSADRGTNLWRQVRRDNRATGAPGRGRAG